MKWLIIKNTRDFTKQEIPLLLITEWRAEVVRKSLDNCRIVSLFHINEKTVIKFYCVLADDVSSQLFINSTYINNDVKEYESLSIDIPAFHLFEREIWEETGIIPLKHPWLKNVRYSENRFDKTQKMENYQFFHIKGESIHEVGVGPVHAGIIEPGHFRFSCFGEDVYNLEIQLGYQHRGVENLFLQKQTKAIHLAESIAGDSVIANGTAYAYSLEALSNCEISKTAHYIRGLALEIERIAMHLADLSAISNDIAYLMGSAFFSARRTLIINSLLNICGSRFGRGLIRLGGTAFDLTPELVKKLKKVFIEVNEEITIMSGVMFSSANVLSRLQNIGIINKENALKIGLVGLMARASGISQDIRVDHPWGMYKQIAINPISLENGDVFARAFVRFAEIKQSFLIIDEIFSNILYEKNTLKTITELLPNQMVISLIEGWRGEIVHIVSTNNEKQIDKYKIIDPSFHNWLGLSLALRTNEISDFPLCNKSFNLSYAGFDL